MLLKAHFRFIPEVPTTPSAFLSFSFLKLKSRTQLIQTLYKVLK